MSDTPEIIPQAPFKIGDRVAFTPWGQHQPSGVGVVYEVDSYAGDWLIGARDSTGTRGFFGWSHQFRRVDNHRNPFGPGCPSVRGAGWRGY